MSSVRKCAGWRTHSGLCSKCGRLLTGSRCDRWFDKEVGIPSPTAFGLALELAESESKANQFGSQAAELGAELGAKLIASEEKLSLAARVSMQSIHRHMDRMECYSCHAAWAPQCYGCHVKVDYS